MQKKDTRRILVHLKSVGSAPILRRNKIQLSGEKSMMDIQLYIQNVIATTKTIYLYCGSGFSPSPYQLMEDLYDCFQSNGELVIYYGIQESWG